MGTLSLTCLRTRRPARVVIPKQVEEDGKSECLSVMEGIGDETIAPTRKRADFHLVIYRKIGLLIAPDGDDVISPSGVLRLPFRG